MATELSQVFMTHVKVGFDTFHFYIHISIQLSFIYFIRNHANFTR